ncbi:hypothetical protein U9M48_034550, partial [Paspalum notatum var. saurae]
IAKIISKLLANRLALCLDRLVSRSQSALIIKCSIHDNFLYTQNSVKELHRSRTPALFLKLDFAKAFDSVRWDYFFEVLQQLASSALFVNVVRGNCFQHGRDLRQDDPLSPLLFILALDPIKKIQRGGLVHPSNYHSFRGSLWFNHNYCKVCCLSNKLGGLNLADIMESLYCAVTSFPCKYLGLPLNNKPLRRMDIQPMIEKLGAKLSAWKGRLLDKVGKLTLVNAILTTIPIHFLTIFPLKNGSECMSGGHCLVKWPKWNEEHRPWVGTTPPCDKIDAALFRACTVVTGKAPIDIIPNLYPLAWRKNKHVNEELVNLNWTRGLWRMQSVQQMAEFIQLWDLVHEAKIFTANTLIQRQWSCNPVCVICDQEPKK